MKALVFVLAWWFMSNGAGGPATHGPFADKAQCEALAAWLRAHYYTRQFPSWCWWDGKP